MKLFYFDIRVFFYAGKSTPRYYSSVIEIKYPSIDTSFVNSGIWRIPNDTSHATSFLTLSPKLRSSLSIEFTISSCNLCSTHLLRLGLLNVTNPNQCEQSIEMPSLTLKWNLKNRHPIVNKLSCNNISTLWGAGGFVEPRCRHLSIDVIVNICDVFFRKLRKN